MLYKRDSQSLLGPVLLKGIGWKVSLVTGSEMKGRGQERCSHSQAQHGGIAVWNCVHIYICLCMHVRVCLCMYILSAQRVSWFVFLLYLCSLNRCVFSAFATFSLLVSSCLSAVFAVLQSVCLLGPWRLLWKVDCNILSISSRYLLVQFLLLF